MMMEMIFRLSAYLLRVDSYPAITLIILITHKTRTKYSDNYCQICEYIDRVSWKSACEYHRCADNPRSGCVQYHHRTRTANTRLRECIGVYRTDGVILSDPRRECSRRNQTYGRLTLSIVRSGSLSHRRLIVGLFSGIVHLCGDETGSDCCEDGSEDERHSKPISDEVA
jgi:hypothetical protein